jgi:hypothetical protein
LQDRNKRFDEMRILWTNHIRRRGHDGLAKLQRFWQTPIDLSQVSSAQNAQGTRTSTTIWGEMLQDPSHFADNYVAHVQLHLEHHWQRYRLLIAAVPVAMPIGC